MAAPHNVQIVSIVATAANKAPKSRPISTLNCMHATESCGSWIMNHDSSITFVLKSKVVERELDACAIVMFLISF